MTARSLMVAAFVLASTAAARNAAAQDPTAPPPATTPTPAATPMATGNGGFGSLHQLVISGELQASIMHESQSMGGTSTTAIMIQPAADYFIAPNISVGGALTIAHGSTSFSGGGVSVGGSTTTIGLQVRGGYNLAINDMLSFWPQLGLGYMHQSFDSGTPGGGSASGYTVPLEVFAPFLWHIVPHLFVGIGPALHIDLLSKVEGNDAPKTTDIGLSSVVGGYFGS